MPKSEPQSHDPLNVSARPLGYRMFSDSQLAEIHYASLEILRRTGVRVFESESLALLQEAGAIASDENLVRFPPDVVERALRDAPSRIVLCDRNGRAQLYLEGHRTYFGTGSDLPNFLDLETGQRRLSRLSDVADMARLADALPNLDFIMSMALPSDVPPATSDRRSFYTMLTNSIKPIIFTAWDENGLADIIKMAELVAGGPEKLRLNPFLFAYLEPTSPLQHSEDVLRKVLLMVDHGLPFVYAPGPVDGASAPMTPAGSLAMANAEVLSGLVIAQQRRRGTPFLWGSGSGPMDMRHTTATYASPEFMLHTMGMAELAHHYYNLPVWGFSGCSDSKLPDMQAGIESALWILWTALSGANLVHDVGYIESGLTCSPEMMVVGDEIIGFVRRLLGGITLTPETLALDVIDAVGPGGNYLAHKHTRNHYREMWLPRIFDRRMYQSWENAGRPTAQQSARELAREIIANHEVPPLAEETLTGLQAILHEADVKAGVD